jgi:beta-1,4-N-acetylglucosaminyltransferase
MIFLTVGTQFPFDRLVMAIDDMIGKGLIDEEVFAQIGESSYKPLNFEYVISLEKKQFDDYITKTSKIISHAGMGTITMAMEYDIPLLVMPRLKKYNEVVNDHQVDIAEKFEKLGYLLVAYTVDQIPDRIKQLETFVPEKRDNHPHLVAARITQFLDSLEVNG